MPLLGRSYICRFAWTSKNSLHGRKKVQTYYVICHTTSRYTVCRVWACVLSRLFRPPGYTLSVCMRDGATAEVEVYTGGRPTHLFFFSSAFRCGGRFFHFSFASEEFRRPFHVDSPNDFMHQVCLLARHLHAACICRYVCWHAPSHSRRNLPIVGNETRSKRSRGDHHVPSCEGEGLGITTGMMCNRWDHLVLMEW